MEIGYIVLRCRTAFYEMQICSLVYNDQCMLKLSGSRCIQSEIGLQRNLYGYTLWYINKGTA